MTRPLITFRIPNGMEVAHSEAVLREALLMAGAKVILEVVLRGIFSCRTDHMLHGSHGFTSEGNIESRIPSQLGPHL